MDDETTTRTTLPGGRGEMAMLFRMHDWAATPLGPVEQWPQSLRTAVSICLASGFPQLIWWGPELIQIYNDGYRPVLGAKHPRSLGQRGHECWAEIWGVLGPMYEQVRNTGQSLWFENLLLVMERYGFAEETYFTFSYSAIEDESGGVGGVLVTCVETTEQVLAERRLRTLRDLGAATSAAKTADEACVRAVELLARNESDVPFALIYLVDADGRVGVLAGATPASLGEAVRPAAFELTADEPTPWPLAASARSGEALVVDVAPEHLGALPDGPWPLPPYRAVVLPLRATAQERPAGWLVAGINPGRVLDDEYRSFFELAAEHVATAVANARAYEEERRRAEALAEIDRAKTEFFSNVSHEFRTPLTLMLGPAEDALADPATEPRSRERVEVVHRNALRLLKLVNTLLDFSRIEAGRAEAVYEPTDLAAYTAELASSFRSAVERAGLRLVVDAPPLPEPVYVDRDMWEKIVLNLLSNAFKHTFEGDIVVAVRAVGTEAELTVRDTGVGIADDQLPHVFERFHRVPNARSRTHEGSGIGLALVRELVRLHGGTIEVESTVGEGTTFRVRVPRGTAHLAPEHVASGGRQRRASGAVTPAAFVEEARRWLPEEGALGFRPSAVGPAAPAESREPTAESRILLADDNADMREYAARLLRGRGWEVTAVADGVAALEAVRRTADADGFDLVLSDVMMPRLDGFGLLRALRAEPSTRTLPVILLSARAGEEARVEGLDAGADDYLVKPFTARELVARVGAHLALARDRARAVAALEAARVHLQRVLMQTPAAVAITLGPDHRIESVNEMYVRVFGRRDYVGRLGCEAFPEVEAQGFLALMDEVYRTGVPYVGAAARLTWDREGDGTMREGFLDFVYQPLVDADGRTEGILTFAVDVTEQLLARHAVEQLLAESEETRQVIAEANEQLEEQQLEVELTNRQLQDNAAELEAANDELQRTSEELTERTAAAERAIGRVTRLQALTAALAASYTPEEVAAVVVAEGVAVTGAATGVLALRAPDDPDALVMYRQTGLPRDVLDRDRRFPLAAPVPTATSIRTGESIWLESGDAVRASFPTLAGMWAELDTRALAAVPLAAGGEVIGAMSFTFIEPRAFAAEDRDFFTALARQCAQALERARLFAAERAARGEAEAARERADQANRAKSEFLAAMSHELRTPLNAIAGYAQLIELGLHGPVTDAQRQALGRIQKSEQHLLALINDILNFAKLEAGRVEYDLRPVPLVEAVADVLAMVEPQLSARRLAREVRIAPDRVARADREKVQQILLNLLSNAVKFTEPGGRITLDAPTGAADPDGTSDGMVLLRVTDTGCGIPQDKQEAIFDPFVQVHRHLTRLTDGTGLGLAISRDLARGMGGDLSVRSEEGRGSTFTLMLPAA